MQILKRANIEGCGTHLIVVFGLGLIGTSIFSRLFNYQCKLLTQIYFDWNNQKNRNEAFRQLVSVINDESPAKLSVVWSAGKSAFHSTEEEISQEHLPFIELVNRTQEIRLLYPEIKLRFHYLSSAGGLFEGQRVVDGNTAPLPIRPYGRLKLEQERVLLDLFGSGEIIIYRPSSVFGPMQQEKQKGLINNLISNAHSRKTTVLDANVMSLRDYVFAGDIGNYIAKRIISGKLQPKANPINMLVSARCTSLFEVVRKIENVLNVKLHFKLDESFGNSSNITFSPGVLPPDWFASPLSVGIRQFLIAKQQFSGAYIR